MKKVVFIIALLLSLVSCKFNRDEDNKKYSYKKEWETNIRSSFQVVKPLQIENYLYFVDEPSEKSCQLVKIDLQSGNIVNQSQILNQNEIRAVSSALHLYKDKIFFMDYDNYIYFYSIDSLQCVLKKRIGTESDFNNDYYTRSSGNIEIYEGNLYYGNLSRVSGEAVVKINIDSLFSCKDDVFIPEFVNPNCSKNAIFNIKIHNGILYYIPHNSLRKKEEKYIPILFAWDLKNNKLLWNQRLESEECGTNCAIQIINNRLILLDKNFYCFDLLTGNILYSKKYKRTNPYSEITPNLHLFLSEMLVYDDKIFCTGNDCEALYGEGYGHPKEYVKNLYCIDSKDGKIIWSDLIENTGSLDALPFCLDNKLYISTFAGFRIYNKTNGKLLADFDNFCSYQADHLFYYDSKFIFFDYDRDNKQGRYVAITITEDEK